ncbi:MAG: ATP-binding protein [Clostridia bacterium]|nr:ATP-binding protein [Clostridia bacterium]
MLSRENVMREALSELEAQRARNLMEEKARRAEAEQRKPAIAALLARRQQLLFSSMRGAFASPGRAKEISASMQCEMEGINAELRRELVSCGLPEDYLQPVYRCALCRDTGYVGEPVHEQCVCLKRAVLNRLYQNEGLQGLERENFASFDERIFPDVPIEGRKNTQRGYIKKIRERCEGFADGFAPGEGNGLLLCGRSGLGKTFLMNCVAQRVLERGFSVVVISAYRLTEAMRRFQFGGEGAETVQDMLSCDLLCIDDLGSEPMIRGVTVSALYHIVSERRNANRSTVVTTNCSVDQLYEKYDDRIAARLCDPGRMQVMEFVGVDVRRFAAPRGDYR